MEMVYKNKMNKFTLQIFLIILFSPVHAEQAKDWQLGFQPPASKSMLDIALFHDYLLLPVITAITVFVLFLVVYSCIKFRESKNPVPSKTSHNTYLEI